MVSKEEEVVSEVVQGFLPQVPPSLYFLMDFPASIRNFMLEGVDLLEYLGMHLSQVGFILAFLRVQHVQLVSVLILYLL